MNHLLTGTLGCSLRALILAAAVSPAAAAPSYVITDLGTLPGFAASAGYSINNFGQVSGSAATDAKIVLTGTIHGFLWTPVAVNSSIGSMTDLGAAEVGSSGATKINEYGQVILNGSWPGVGGNVAFLWTPTAARGSTGSALPIVSTSFPSSVFGINNLGQLVGRMYPGTSFVWTPDARNGTTGATNHTLTQGANGPYYAPGYNNFGYADAINDSGQVTGSVVLDPYGRPFIHNNGRVSFPAQNPYDFGTLGAGDVLGPPFQYNNQEGAGAMVAINAVGHAAGNRVFVDAQGQAALLPAFWDGSQFHGIGIASGYSALGINKQDDVVGYTLLANANGQSGAFLYRKGVLTELRDLVDPSLGWRLDRAWAINDAGQIVGEGVLGGVTRAFLMTPGTADVSAQVMVTRHGLRYSGNLKAFFQDVTLTNTGAATVTGPLSLVLAGLPVGVTLVNATGTTLVETPAGRPFINASAASLAAGAQLTITLRLGDPADVPIRYSTQVLAGTGTR